VNPGEIDVVLLKKLRTLFRVVAKRARIGIVVGGGAPARAYAEAARKLGVKSDDALHRIGIRATHLNAELVRHLFGARASSVITEYGKPLPPHRILIGAGEKPGYSTDFDSVLLAEKLGTTLIYNLSNVDFIYTGDPKTKKNATPLPDLTWKEYFRRFPLRHVRPGLHMPFDPKAALRAKKNGMIVVFVNGKKLGNLRNALTGKRFRATVVHP
jgi:uridylate kinase